MISRDLQARIAHDIGDFCDLLMANALRAPSLSSASPIEPEEVSTEGFNRLSQSSREAARPNKRAATDQ